MKILKEECPDDQENEEKERIAYNKNEGVINKDDIENEIETNQDNLRKVM